MILKYIGTKKLSIVSAMVVFVFLTGCDEQQNMSTIEQDALDAIVQAKQSSQSLISQEEADAILHNFPPPLELAVEIKVSRPQFNEARLCNPDITGKLSSSFDKAFSLGMLGADIGYMHLYDQATMSINYLTALKGLSEELKIGTFFSFDKVRKMAENSNNIDSLLSISKKRFDELNVYLRKKKRGNISAAILIGGWSEVLFIATQEAIAADEIGPLAEHIAAQKRNLDDIMMLLSIYKSDPEFSKMYQLFKDLKHVYNDVMFTSVEDRVESNGSTLGKEEGEIAITSDQLYIVSVKLAAIRNYINGQ